MAFSPAFEIRQNFFLRGSLSLHLFAHVCRRLGDDLPAHVRGKPLGLVRNIKPRHFAARRDGKHFLGTEQVGDVIVRDVDAAVTAGQMPYVLLGNSFLSRFQMTRTNDQMVLEKRY